MSEYFDPTVDNGAHDESRMGDALADHLLAEAAASLQSDTDADVLAEAAEILKVVANHILFGKTSGKCKDHNGNPVGKWEIV